MKKILVIEDNPEQKKIAREVIEAAKHYCYVAEDLHEAMLLLTGNDILNSKNSHEPEVKWDGVIVDIHFPLITGSKGPDGKAEPRGIEIMALCKELGLPCVVCTDMDHHHTNWLDRLLPYFDADLVADKGNGAWPWERALGKLLAKIVKHEENLQAASDRFEELRLLGERIVNDDGM